MKLAMTALFPYLAPTIRFKQSDKICNFHVASTALHLIDFQQKTDTIGSGRELRILTIPPVYSRYAINEFYSFNAMSPDHSTF
jgi:hypothetical protein